VSRARASSDQTAPVKSVFLTQLQGIWIGLCVIAFGLAIVPFFSPALPPNFWMFPASMAVPAFLYWMYLQGEALRPARSRLA
jgi:hypothetical protein